MPERTTKKLWARIVPELKLRQLTSTNTVLPFCIFLFPEDLTRCPKATAATERVAATYFFTCLFAFAFLIMAAE